MNSDVMTLLTNLASGIQIGWEDLKKAQTPSPRLPTDGFTLDVLQEEQSVWALHNFGVRPEWHPLLGIVEEAGELCEAMLRLHDVEEIGRARLESFNANVDKVYADVEDAIGDMIVFMTDFCKLMKFDPPEALLMRATQEPVAKPPWVLAPKLAHAFLKKAQGIRGTPAQHDETMKDLLRDIYGYLEQVSIEVAGKRASTIAQETWSRVKLRNWKKDAITGGEP